MDEPILQRDLQQEPPAQEESIKAPEDLVIEEPPQLPPAEQDKKNTSAKAIDLNNEFSLNQNNYTTKWERAKNEFYFLFFLLKHWFP